MNILEKINEQGVSIIIGARNEFPQIAMTIASLMEDMYSSGITKFEFILMDNGSTDETSRFFAWKPIEKGNFWKYQYSPRGLVNEGLLRIFYDPVLSNVGTRNKGVLHAKYENIIFSDAHITVRLGTIKSILETLNKYGGIVHAPISWMGASCYNDQAGMQYSYKVGEKIWGTWNKVQVAATPFYIPICGHAFLAVKRKQFLDFRGYPYAQRVYGGGEPYLDTKYWMLGSTSMMDPRALVYHLSAGRGYSWHNNDLIHNMLLVSYILGGQKWVDRIRITYLNNERINHSYLNLLTEEALKEGKEDYEWLQANKKYDFEQVLALDDYEPKLYPRCEKCTKRGHPDPHEMRPWDFLNEQLHGNHRSFVAEFKLRKDEKGNIFIGNTPIIDPKAIEVANKYF